MRKVAIIQCANNKSLKSWRYKNQNIIFVADKTKFSYCSKCNRTPYEADDFIPDSPLTWREAFLDYHTNHQKPEVLQDSDELPEAWQLYTNSAYEILVKQCGKENIFILSAGWGLINAGFLLPPYNITFSNPKKEKYAKTTPSQVWKRLKPLGYNPLSTVTDKNTSIYFFGGKEYLDLLYKYTDDLPVTKIIYYISTKIKTERQGYKFNRFTPTNSKRMTNWHYECANQFANGDLNI